MTRIYEKCWSEGPFSSFHMFEYLASKASEKKDPLKIIQELKKVKVEDYMKSPRFRDKDGLYKPGKTGLCTSLAIKCVRGITHNDDDQASQSSSESETPMYDFRLYDTSGHRLARCKRTGILFDSSLQTPERVRVNDCLEVSETKAYYFDRQGDLHALEKIAKGDRKGQWAPTKIYSPLETLEEGLSLCLRQYVKKADKSTLCFLRYVIIISKVAIGGTKILKLAVADLEIRYQDPATRRLLYDGLIRWVFADRRLILSWYEKPNLEQQVGHYIRFGDPWGTPDTGDFCMDIFQAFTEGGNGPDHRRRQYRVVEDVQDELWSKMVNIHGEPVIEGWPIEKHNHESLPGERLPPVNIEKRKPAASPEPTPRAGRR